MATYSSFTKYDTSWPFYLNYMNWGGNSKAWLDENFDAIGKKDTLNLQEWEPDYHQPNCQLLYPEGIIQWRSPKTSG